MKGKVEQCVVTQVLMGKSGRWYRPSRFVQWS